MATQSPRAIMIALGMNNSGFVDGLEDAAVKASQFQSVMARSNQVRSRQAIADKQQEVNARMEAFRQAKTEAEQQDAWKEAARANDELNAQKSVADSIARMEEKQRLEDQETANHKRFVDEALEYEKQAADDSTRLDAMIFEAKNSARDVDLRNANRYFDQLLEKHKTNEEMRVRITEARQAQIDAIMRRPTGIPGQFNRSGLAFRGIANVVGHQAGMDSSQMAVMNAGMSLFGMRGTMSFARIGAMAGSAGAAVKGFGAALGLAGVVGGAAIGALAVGFYAMHRHVENARKAAEEAAESLKRFVDLQSGFREAMFGKEDVSPEQKSLRDQIAKNNEERKKLRENPGDDLVSILTNMKAIRLIVDQNKQLEERDKIIGLHSKTLREHALWESEQSAKAVTGLAAQEAAWERIRRLAVLKHNAEVMSDVHRGGSNILSDRYAMEAHRLQSRINDFHAERTARDRQEANAVEQARISARMEGFDQEMALLKAKHRVEIAEYETAGKSTIRLVSRQIYERQALERKNLQEITAARREIQDRLDIASGAKTQLDLDLRGLKERLRLFGMTNEGIREMTKLWRAAATAEANKTLTDQFQDMADAIEVAAGRMTELAAEAAKLKRDNPLADQSVIYKYMEFQKRLNDATDAKSIREAMRSPVEQFKAYRDKVLANAQMTDEEKSFALNKNMGELMGKKTQSDAGTFTDMGSWWQDVQSKLFQADDGDKPMTKDQADDLIDAAKKTIEALGGVLDVRLAMR